MTDAGNREEHEQSSAPSVPNWLTASFFTGLAAFLGIVIWALMEQNRTLQQTLAQATPIASVSSDVAVGEKLSDLNAVSLDGEKSSFARLIAGRVSIVTVFHTTCPYCRETLPSWEALWTDTRETRASMLAISLHPVAPTKAYVRENRIGWPVHTVTVSTDLAALRVSRVPTTLVVGPQGTVVGSWRGVLSDIALSEIRDEVQAAIARIPN